VIFAAHGESTVLWLGGGWIASLVAVASASGLQGERRASIRAGASMFALPLISAVVCIGLLLAGNVYDLPVAGAILAALALALVIVRTTVTFRENLVLLESRRQAVTDDLTGLANRRLLGRRMDLAFEEEEEAAGEDGAIGVLLLDLDRFKELNDTLGHHAGDQLLSLLGRRLKSAVPEAAVIARLGGDEFAVLFDTGADDTTLATAGARIATALSEPFAFDGHAFSASIGGALSTDGAHNASELLQQADVAMYRAKRAGVPYTHFSSDHDEHPRDRFITPEDRRARPR
jgi:diguanylate cyclase (GGDEF)-like protein